MTQQSINYLERQHKRFSQAIEYYDNNELPLMPKETKDHVYNVFKERLKKITNQLNQLYTQAGLEIPVEFEIVKQ